MRSAQAPLLPLLAASFTGGIPDAPHSPEHHLEIQVRVRESGLRRIRVRIRVEEEGGGRRKPASAPAARCIYVRYTYLVYGTSTHQVHLLHSCGATRTRTRLAPSLPSLLLAGSCCSREPWRQGKATCLRVEAVGLDAVPALDA